MYRPVLALGPHAAVLLLVLVAAAGCAATPSNQSLTSEAQATIERFLDRDAAFQSWFDNAYGYAVFPEVGKAGFWVGGAFGHGIVFEQGEPVGRTTVTQATIGPQIGAQSFSQVIFFRDEAALRTYQRENFEFSAQASAIAATAGAATSSSYERGVAVFIFARGGLMAEASVGGQRFRYEPL